MLGDGTTACADGRGQVDRADDVENIASAQLASE
jgi:hypothetical protein